MAIKLLYCIQSLHNSGGMERVLTTKANYLADKLGYEIHIAEKCNQGTPYFQLSSNIICHNLNARNNREYKKTLSKLLYEVRPDLQSALSAESTCSDFIIQEFIDKEYEINFLGVRTDNNFIVAGGIKKLRHYPQTIGACSFGLFQPQNHYRLDINALKRFLNSTNYHGLFSAEFLYKAGKYYFMEVNFRNDGLAYAATAAGANLHSLYVSMKQNPSIIKIRPTYMMDYSIDFLYVKNKNLPFYKWVKDLLRTRCFININFGDLNPTFHHYIDKIKSKLNHQ